MDMRIRTSELIGTALDWAVGKAAGKELPIGTFGPVFGKGFKAPSFCGRRFHPSECWDEAGPFIRNGRISLIAPAGHDQWIARKFTPDKDTHAEAYADEPLVAAMRCLVLSRLGDEVDVPSELV